LNTDDPGLFGTSILDEFALMWPALANLHVDAERRLNAFGVIRQRSCELNPTPGVSSTLAAIDETRAQWKSIGLLPKPLV
jgi:hypothetical protein